MDFTESAWESLMNSSSDLSRNSPEPETSSPETAPLTLPSRTRKGQHLLVGLAAPTSPLLNHDASQLSLAEENRDGLPRMVQSPEHFSMGLDGEKAGETPDGAGDADAKKSESGEDDGKGATTIRRLSEVFPTQMKKKQRRKPQRRTKHILMQQAEQFDDNEDETTGAGYGTQWPVSSIPAVKGLPRMSEAARASLDGVAVRSNHRQRRIMQIPPQVLDTTSEASHESHGRSGGDGQGGNKDDSGATSPEDYHLQLPDFLSPAMSSGASSDIMTSPALSTNATDISSMFGISGLPSRSAALANAADQGFSFESLQDNDVLTSPFSSPEIKSTAEIQHLSGMVGAPAGSQDATSAQDTDFPNILNIPCSTASSPSPATTSGNHLPSKLPESERQSQSFIDIILASKGGNAATAKQGEMSLYGGAGMLHGGMIGGSGDDEALHDSHEHVSPECGMKRKAGDTSSANSGSFAVPYSSEFPTMNPVHYQKRRLTSAMAARSLAHHYRAGSFSLPCSPFIPRRDGPAASDLGPRGMQRSASTPSLWDNKPQDVDDGFLEYVHIPPGHLHPKLMADLSSLPTAADLREATAEAEAAAAASKLPATPSVDALPTAEGADISTLSPKSRSAATTPPPQHAVPEIPPSAPTTAPSLGFGGWGFASGFSWNGLVDAVKKQSEVVVDVYKRDLAEFVTVVASESSSGVDRLTHTLRATISGDDEEDERTPQPSEIGEEEAPANEAAAPESLRAGETVGGNDGPSIVDEIGNLAEQAESLINTFSTGLTNFLSAAVTLVPAPEEVRPQKRIIYDRKSALIESIRNNPATFLVDPASTESESANLELAARFKDFIGGYDARQHITTITRLLDESAELKQMLDRLVPHDVSYDDFWARYFFRVAQIEKEEETRRRVITDAAEEEEFTWGTDDDEEEEGCAPVLDGKVEEKQESGVIEESSLEGVNPGTESADQDAPIPANSPPTPSKQSVDLTESFELVSDPEDGQGVKGVGEVNPATGSAKKKQVDGERSEDDWGDWE
ncbi:hypothetical protein HK104_007878 [Borealophlyctis nickersoniae]|nr:hypothetical protein HK104_007878 [Borealophlyctis nickersoniae]